MEERLAAGAAAQPEGPESEREEEATRVRVTDRRRVHADEAEGGGERAQAAPDAPSLRPSYVEELEARTRAAEQKLQDVQSRFEQVRAELRRETDETRQRLMRSARERAEREKATFVAALLPVIDNLQRAVEAAEQGGSMESLLDGLRGTISGFESALAASGAEAIDAVGRQFDPEVHEAVDTAEVEPAREGQVTAQYGRGYRMGGQLLRPARVQVGRASADASRSATE